MPLINNNLSPLPFYDSYKDWNHKSFQAFGELHPLIIHRNYLLPFQVIVKSANLNTLKVRLYSYNTGNSIDITKSMLNSGLSVKQYGTFAILVYTGIGPISELKQEGQYYLRIELDSTSVLISDIFASRNNVDDCIKLEYSNSYNFELKDGVIDFSDNFTFICYLPTQIGYPNYQFEETVTNRMGYSYMESQVSKKVYQFVFIAPEYLCDALRIVRMCETKRIISNDKAYEAINFNMSVEWQEQGNLAAVTCEFETDNVIANIGGLKQITNIGDFNKDFNKDFYTE